MATTSVTTMWMMVAKQAPAYWLQRSWMRLGPGSQLGGPISGAHCSTCTSGIVYEGEPGR
jgi:hypothetical protein